MRTPEIAMYIVVRTDLGMSPGKIAAQVGHAVQLAMRLAESIGGEFAANLERWELGSYAKIVLGATDAEFFALSENNEAHCAMVQDEGRTEVRTGTWTCLALPPMRKDAAFPFVGKLRLYK